VNWSKTKKQIGMGVIMKQDFDSGQGYCRKLGHYLTFHYCRQEHHSLPCPKIRDCWFSAFDIDQFLRENYKTEDISYLQNIPTAKVGTIIELIRQAHQNTGQL
jgi:hypothetical protein